MGISSPPRFRSLRQCISTIWSTAPRELVEAAALTFVVSATEGAGLLLLVPLLQLVGVDVQGGELAGIERTITSAFLRLGVQPTLASVLAIFVGINVLQSVVQRRHAIVNVTLQQRVVTVLRNRLYRAMAGSEWTAFSRVRASDCAQLLTDEVGRVGTAVHCLLEFFVLASTALFYFAIALRVSATMAAIVAVAGAALGIVLRGENGRARRIGEDLSAAWTDVYAAVHEHFAGLRLAKVYGAERAQADAFASLSDRLDLVGRAAAVSAARLQQQLTLGSAVVLAVVVYVSYVILGVSTAQLLLLLFLFGRLIPRVTGLYARTQAIAMSLPAFDAVAAAEARSLEAAESRPAADRDIAFVDKVELERVSFSYSSDRAAAVLRDVTLALPARGMTAIVGPSGAGKSTLIDLLLGLLTPSGGRILVDGVELTPDYISDWRRQIGYVPQDTFLFHGTIRANLLWAHQSASDTDLWDALKRSSAVEFVAAFPKGLDTLVGDRGVLLSGGERQRLALARALLRRPRLLVLDEATSAIDVETETHIRRALQDLEGHMAVLVVAHRLSTIRGANAIFVVDEGRVVESGSWAALMSNRTGRFRHLYDAQDAESPGHHSAEHRLGVAS